MAEKKQESKKVLERMYNIPLRKEFMKVPKYKRAKKTIKALKEFMTRHMKSEDIKIGKHLNLEVWKHGIKNPPHHVKVNAVKNDEGRVDVELVGAPVEEVKKEEPKKAEKKTETNEKEDRANEVKKEEKPEQAKKEKTPETTPKKEEKAKITELKKKDVSAEEKKQEAKE